MMHGDDKISVIGVMSGTSLDGLDIVLCDFQPKDNGWVFKIKKTHGLEYNDYWRKALTAAFEYSGRDLLFLHKRFGRLIGEEIKKSFSEFNDVDLIASHGHTIFHEPEKGLNLQIGDGNEIAAVTGIDTVFDFRSLDIARGGQGAPLVPVGDKLLFNEYDACINLGGFANVSMDSHGKRVGFDIAPCNYVLNHLVRNSSGESFDKDGKNGMKGTMIDELYQKLNDLPFYQTDPPRSLGREWVENIFLPVLEPWLDQPDHMLRTVYQHIAHQIIASLPSSGKVLVTGGGAFNGFLIDLIRQGNHSLEVVIPDKELVEYKESVIFAFLGVLSIRNQYNILPDVTGAKCPSISGNLVKGVGKK